MDEIARHHREEAIRRAGELWDFRYKSGRIIGWAAIVIFGVGFLALFIYLGFLALNPEIMMEKLNSGTIDSGNPEGSLVGTVDLIDSLRRLVL